MQRRNQKSLNAIDLSISWKYDNRYKVVIKDSYISGQY